MADKRVAECLEAEEGDPEGMFNGWEIGFLYSLQKRSQELTDKQEEKLTDLYSRACNSNY